jgi:elongation factor Tu
VGVKDDLSSGVDQVHVYTMRELNQDTAGTIQRINESGRPAVITRHGRFVAVIYPLANTPVEARAIARALEDVEVRGQLTGQSTVSGVYTAQEAADELDVTVDVGDNVGIQREVERSRGVKADPTTTPHTEFEGEVYILSRDEGGRHTPFLNNQRFQFHFRTTDVTGVVTLQAGTEMVMPGDGANISVKLTQPAAMDEGVRFAIREGGRTVGAGRVTKIIH